MPHTGFKFDGSEAPHFPDVVRLQSLVAARLKSTDVASQVRGGRKKGEGQMGGGGDMRRGPHLGTVPLASQHLGATVVRGGEEEKADGVGVRFGFKFIVRRPSSRAPESDRR